MRLFILTTLLLLQTAVFAQGKWFTRTGHISFYSSTPVEDIEARNSSAASVLDQSTGQIQFSVDIKSFMFEKALMQEHFNENYMESDEFPQATFKGKIVNIDAVDWSSVGDYNVTVKGDLTIHGETQTVESSGVIRITADGGFKAKTEFNVAPSDYKINIPELVSEKIAKEITVKVKADYKPLKR